VDAVLVDSLGTSASAPGRLYEAFGIRIRSEIPLPMLPLEDDPSANVTIRLAADGQAAPKAIGPIQAGVACSHGTIHTSRHASEHGTLLISRVIGTMLISPDHQTVTVFPAALEIDQRIVGLFLASQVAIFLRSRFGTPVLHCSAVVTLDGVAVFLGDHGQGKSTTAAAFLHRGAELLTDDALPLEVLDGQVFGTPGPAIMKLWDASVEQALHLDRNLPSLFAGTTKRLLQLDRTFRIADRRMPLKAIYLLDRRDGDDFTSVEISPLRKADALGVLMRHTSCSLFLIPSEASKLFAAYAKVVQGVEVRRLTYSSGFDRLERLHNAVLEDLRKQ